MAKQDVATRIEQAKTTLNKLVAEEYFYMQQDSEQNLIFLYENMHTQLKVLLRTELEEYVDYARYVQKKLVNAYIKYGTYLKSEQKDFHAARTSLKKALKLNASLPIAYYRLGFLAYKRQAYAEALQFFNRALQVQGEPKYALTMQQQSYAQLYLTNSALYIAKEANEAWGRLPQVEQLPNYELSPIFAQLSDQEQLMANQSFYCISEHNVETCALKRCEYLREVGAANTLILYFSDRENVCIYNGREISLLVNIADTLRHLLLTCSEKNPGTRQQFQAFFMRYDDNDEVRANTFRQRMSRLRGKLAQIGLMDAIIQTRVQDETAYYIKAMPFFVLYRVDEHTPCDYAHEL